MKKIGVEPSKIGYPMPVVIIGTEIYGKVNFMTAAWVTHVNLEPPMLAICLSKDHLTTETILKNKTFSVSFPDTKLAAKSDFCGLKSGKEIDKSGIFKVFYGKVKNVPLIEECPLSVVCQLKEVHSVAGDMLLIGEVVEAFSEERYLNQGAPDVKTMDLLVFTMPDNHYWSLGELIGQAFEIGNSLSCKLPHDISLRRKMNN